MKSLNRDVIMRCPVCGNDQFESMNREYDELVEAPGTVQLRCSDCNAVYSKDELIAENAELIDIVMEEMKDEVIKEFERDFKKVMKKWKV